MTYGNCLSRFLLLKCENYLDGIGIDSLRFFNNEKRGRYETDDPFN